MPAPLRVDAPLDLAADRRVVRLPPAPASPRALAIVLWLIAVAVTIFPAAVVRFGPSAHTSYDLLVAIPKRVAPGAEIPPVEPVLIRSLSADQARAFNASVPFSDTGNPPARPFRFAGTPDDLARASDCLAAAAYYEAGEDPAGQRAVMQVVLNRVRHPAFPKTVCGVVFQGSERVTGCQFTFACDGALLRRAPTPDGWRRAQSLASAALAGAVESTVGYATHYHTEWVAPYWQASLDKIVAVHTQIFYRWAGWWGTPSAFDRHTLVGEPVVPALARLSDAHRVGIALTALTDLSVPGKASLDVSGANLAASHGQFMVTLPAGVPASRWTMFADQLCGTRDRCRVMAWRDKASTATTLPLELTQIAALEFSYVRDRAAGIDRPLWNCHDTRRPDPRRCLKRQVLLPGWRMLEEAAAPAAQAGVSAAPSNPAGAAGPTELSGVHKAQPVMPAAPASTLKIAPPTTISPKIGHFGERSSTVTPPGTFPAAVP